MENRYFKRNFDDHHKDYCGDRLKEEASVIVDNSFSDTMYDRNRGVSLFHVPNPYCEGEFRIISDVEIVMSSDPNVACYFSEQHRQSLMNAIKGAPRPAPTRSMSDEELIEYCVPRDLERDEITEHVKQSMRSMDSKIRDQISDDEFQAKFDSYKNIDEQVVNEKN